MTRGSRYIKFEGLIQKDVLGIFSLIRGFANLKDLAEISTSYEMEASATSRQVVGFQRPVNTKHARRLKNYLEKSDYRFLPEIILSVRTHYQFPENLSNQINTSSLAAEGISISPIKGTKNRIFVIKIDRNEIPRIRTEHRIRRIDGNHRLRFANELEEDPTVPTKYLTPFCMILLGPPENESDNYAESLIFHTINSKALNLDSEHALKLMLGQPQAVGMTRDNEFAYDPAFHLTRLLSEWMQDLPTGLRNRLGSRPLTALSATAHTMIDADPIISGSLANLSAFSEELFAILYDILSQLQGTHSLLCKNEYFLDLAARVWKDTNQMGQEDRVAEAVRFLKGFGDWLIYHNLTNLQVSNTLSDQLLLIYKNSQNQMPKKIFLARWYPSTGDGAMHISRSGYRLDQIRRTLQEIQQEIGVNLELIDLGTTEGGTYPIHSILYEAVESSDIILIDLTGIRPNVCVESGYALRHHEKNRLIFLHEKYQDEKVPFDLSAFRYEEFDQAAEIPHLLKPHIKSILDEANKL